MSSCDPLHFRAEKNETQEDKEAFQKALLMEEAKTKATSLI